MAFPNSQLDCYTEVMASFRTERDSMGEMQVPANALYGASTQRAVENFPISDLRMPRAMIRALGLIKWAAAKANGDLGILPAGITNAIQHAAEQVIQGDYDTQFVVDIYQTGSGTSTNMNANEVIAHLAQRALGAGQQEVRPNDHVNQGQSSNDVFPTAIHIATAETIHGDLLPAMDALGRTLRKKSQEFHDVIKIGRTHLQDAVPMRLGQEFRGYAHQVDASAERIKSVLPWIYELPLGGTAVGTGLNAKPPFIRSTIDAISQRSKLPFVEAKNHFEAQGAKDAICFLSGALKAYAVSLTKIANDVRWLGSGPRCGLGELILPAVQPGSSIMPGKVNPVIAESLLMACAQVIGYDAAITWSCAMSNFELNVMMPIIAYDLLDSIHLLAAVSRNFEEKAIRGLQADRERAAAYVEQSLAMCTVLAPEIGYDNAAKLAKEAYETRRTIREVAREKSGLSEERLTQLLDSVSQAGE